MINFGVLTMIMKVPYETECIQRKPNETKFENVETLDYELTQNDYRYLKKELSVSMWVDIDTDRAFQTTDTMPFHGWRGIRRAELNVKTRSECIILI